MFKFIQTAAILALLLGCAGQGAAGEVSAQVVFSGSEVDIIIGYYHDNKKQHKNNGNGNGNGHGKGHKSLPPGIAKNLQRGKPLPPGIAKQSLPSGLLAMLPDAPRGYERIIVDGKVLLVEIATQLIHDVLEDIILN